jgi:hypothetical protein
MIDDRDGVARFYDINALSNFVAKPARRARLGSARPAGRLSGAADRKERGADALRILDAGLRRLAAQRAPTSGMDASWDYAKRLTQRRGADGAMT